MNSFAQLYLETFLIHCSIPAFFEIYIYFFFDAIFYNKKGDKFLLFQYTYVCRLICLIITVHYC